MTKDKDKDMIWRLVVMLLAFPVLTVLFLAGLVVFGGK